MEQFPPHTILQAFNHLKAAVERAVHTQLGDAARLDAQIAECRHLEQSIHSVSQIIL